MQVDSKKKARLERFGGVPETKKADSGELAAKLAARAERFALTKGGDATKGGEAEKEKATTPSTAAAKPSTAAERKDAAQARAAALVKPAANAEQEAKRQVGAMGICCCLVFKRGIGGVGAGFLGIEWWWGLHLQLPLSAWTGLRDILEKKRSTKRVARS